MPPKRQPAVAAYTSRRGVTWYLHEGITKTGRPRYFVAKTIGDGAIAALPPGFTFRESVNGVVSVARVTASTLPEQDLAVVHAALRRHAHLMLYDVRIVKDAIVVFEPSAGRFEAVMRFVRAKGEADAYVAERRRYSGQGSWWTLGQGRIAALARRYVGAIGTDAFFELM
jgi:hypothetical protein